MSLVNLFLLVNLGCEMLYIIDQRLTAQSIAKDKSAQVIREVTNALLSPNFFHYIATTFTDELISIAQARILLSDIACCSLMRLDPQSLDKLLDLMIMIFKWQMFLMTNPDELVNITLRHLHGIGRLMPEQSKVILIDQANQFFFMHWNELNEEKRYSIVRKLNRFLSPFNIRISLLIRMKLQIRDGTFADKAAIGSNEFFRYYIQNLGENIYEKMAHFPRCQTSDSISSVEKQKTNEINCLFQQFDVDYNLEAAEVSKEVTDVVESETFVQQKTKLDELQEKCKMDIVDEAPPVYDDNFQELLNLLDSNPT